MKPYVFQPSIAIRGVKFNVNSTLVTIISIKQKTVILIFTAVRTSNQYFFSYMPSRWKIVKLLKACRTHKFMNKTASIADNNLKY
jgi:hypothetical protein